MRIQSKVTIEVADPVLRDEARHYAERSFPWLCRRLWNSDGGARLVNDLSETIKNPQVLADRWVAELARPDAWGGLVLKLYGEAVLPALYAIEADSEPASDDPALTFGSYFSYAGWGQWDDPHVKKYGDIVKICLEDRLDPSEAARAVYDEWLGDVPSISPDWLGGGLRDGVVTASFSSLIDEESLAVSSAGSVLRSWDRQAERSRGIRSRRLARPLLSDFYDEDRWYREFMACLQAGYPSNYRKVVDGLLPDEALDDLCERYTGSEAARLLGYYMAYRYSDYDWE